MAAREIVVTLRLSEGTTREQFRALKGALVDVRQEITENNKALRENAKQQRDLDKAIKEAGVATEAQAIKERELREERQRLKVTNADLDQSLGALTTQYREVRNDVDGATGAHLRFRDKMAQATIEALRQQGVLGQLGARSEFLRSEIERLNTELSQGKIKEEEFRVSSEKLEQELKQLGTETTKLNAKLDALQKEFNEGRITAEEFRAGTQVINTSVQQNSTAIKQGVSDLKAYALGFVGVIAAAQAAIRVIGNISSTVADFDQQLANIRALGEEFAGSIDAIAQAAIELGPKLGVAPVEALKGFEELAKAGLSTEQILSGALQATLTLSAAGMVDVGEAAETTAAALTQFNLQGEQAGLVTDLLAKGANIAQGTVTDFSAALNQSGLVASQFGLTIEETIGGLTAFAKAGLIGSDAGTSFRQALLRLQNPTEKAKDVMSQYGIVVTNAAGEFLSLEEIAGQLQTRLKDLTEEQRGAALATIFGQDAIRVANILYREGAEGIRAFTQEVNDSGFAQGVAETKLDSLSGSVDKLGAAFDGLVLSIDKGDGIISRALRGLTDAATEFIEILSGNNKFQNFKSQLDDLAEEVGLTTSFINNKSTELLTLGFVDSGEAIKAAKQEMGGFLSIFNRLNEQIGKASTEELLEEFSGLALNIQGKIVSLKQEVAKGTREEEATGNEIKGLQKILDTLVTPALEKLEQSYKDVGNASKTSTELQAEGLGAVATEAEEALGVASFASRNISGGIADLSDQIAKLKAEQEQTTSSDLFAGYQAQIDKLQQSIDLLKGTISQDLVDAANEVPQFIQPSLAQAPLNTPQPIEPDADRQLALLASQQTFQQESLNSLIEYYNTRRLLGETFSEQEQQIFNDLKDAKINILAAEADALGAFGQTLIQLAKDGGAAAKIGLVIEKVAAIASILINTARGIAAAQANAAMIPPLLPPGIPNPAYPAAQAIAAAEIIRLKVLAGANIGLIGAQTIAQFKEGGYTPPGHKNKVVGNVHAGEWVAPQWQVDHPTYGPMIEFLEDQRKRRASLDVPFATGGHVTQTHGTALVNLRTGPVTGMTSQRWSDLQAMAFQAVIAENPPILSISELNKVQRRVDVRESMSRG